MGLKEGIKLILKDDDHPRLTISHGTWRVNASIKNAKSYYHNAIIPKEPWREISDMEYSILTKIDDNTQITEGSFISIIKIPDEILEPFKVVKNAIREGLTRDYVNYLILNDTNCLLGKEQILKYIERYGSHLGKVYIGTNPPNLLSVTYDPQDKEEKLIGLHIDNWYRNNLQERHLSPRRICVNIGVEERYLQFINLPLKALFEALENENSEDQRRFSASSLLGHAFLERFPEYPVVRLKVSPNEAYIASTDNIIHDGSTQYSSKLDIALHIHGNFFPFES
jgi:hypothetical protein